GPALIALDPLIRQVDLDPFLLLRDLGGNRRLLGERDVAQRFGRDEVALGNPVVVDPVPGPVLLVEGQPYHPAGRVVVETVGALLSLRLPEGIDPWDRDLHEHPAAGNAAKGSVRFGADRLDGRRVDETASRHL